MPDLLQEKNTKYEIMEEEYEEKINIKSKKYLQKYFEKLDQLKALINKTVP